MTELCEHIAQTKDDYINKEIVINEAVAKLNHFTRLYGITSLFIAGGFCREMYFGKLWRVNDIDVASAFESEAMQLGGLFASEELNSVPKIYKRSGAAAVEYKTKLGSVRIEFQGNSTNSYMNEEDVRAWMHSSGIEDVPIMNNIYGRDFTINSMVYSLSQDKLLDPTKKAVKDIESKQIASLLPAEMLVKYNPLAILRAIRFALTYDFHIDGELARAMQDGIHNIKRSIAQDRINKELIKILNLNSKEAFDMFKRFDLIELLHGIDIEKYLERQEDD